MKSFSGENAEALAAGEPQSPLNSYQAETQMEDFSMPSLPEQVSTDAPPEGTVAEPQTELPQEKNFRALAGEVEKLKAEREQDRKDYQMQLELLRANSQPRAPRDEPKPKSMFADMSDTDIPNVAEIRKEWESRETQYQGRIQELQVAQFNPDYAEVVEKFAAPLLKEKPSLLHAVLGAENKALALYEIGKLAQQARSASTQASTSQVVTPPPPSNASAPVVSRDAQRIVQNARKPGSIASVGGQSALSQSDYIASMSDVDFMKYATKHLEGI